MGFLEELSQQQQQLTPGDMAEKCKIWLSKNPDDPSAGAVKMVMNMAEENMNMAEENMNMAEENRKKDEEIDSRSLKSVIQEFPCLRDCTLSNPYFPTNHAHVDVRLKRVGEAIASVADSLTGDKFWRSPFVEKGANCDSEQAAQYLVVSLLRAVLKGLGLSNDVEIGQNRTLAGVECDVLLIYKRNRLPFAVLETKKPGNSKEGRRLIFTGDPTTGNCVAGEVFDEMKAIQLFGFPTVVGMITTGNQWRIVGLLNDDEDDDNDRCSESGTPAGADVINKLKQFLSKQKQITKPVEIVGSVTTPTASSPDEQSFCFVQGNEDEDEEAKREIWAGEILPSHEEVNSTDELYTEVKKSGEKIVAQLVLFVATACSHLFDLLEKGNNSPLNGDETINISKKMPCRILTNSKKGQEDEKRKDDVFSFGSVTLKKLNLACFNPDLEKIHVIHHIGMGDYGNVCLGTSSDGSSCCAIKFYHDEVLREKFAKKECENWQKVYGNDVYKNVPGSPILAKTFALKITGGHCLVMPYLHPIRRRDRRGLLKKDMVSTALNTFANCGYIHLDIKWRHLRLWKGNDRGDGIVFLVDLGEGSLSALENMENNAKTWVEKSIEYLTNSAGEPVTDDSPVTPPHEPASKKCKLKCFQDQ